MRIGNVFKPRMINQASCGLIVAPISFSTVIFIFMIISAVPQIMPATTSPCPFKYFVALCTTISIPYFLGCCNTGVRKVLSTTEIILCCWAIFPITAKSYTAKFGFTGVSKNITLVFGLIAASISAGFAISTKVTSIPHRVS